MTAQKEVVYAPNETERAVYQRLFKLYLLVHNAFGTHKNANLFIVMKELIQIRQQVRA